MTQAVCMQQLVQVHLHGPLATRYGRVHELAVDTAGEALHALGTQCKGFADALRNWGGAGFRVRVQSGSGENVRSRWLDEHGLRMRLGNAQRIDIVPATSGRKRNGVGQVILGVVLLVVYYFYPIPAIGQAGYALLLGGAIALLSPVPKGSDSKAKEEVSRAIAGPANVTSAGGAVPVVIGRMLVGSVTISAGLSTDQLVVETVDPGAPDLPEEEPQYWDAQPGGDL